MNTDEKQVCANGGAAKRNVVSSVNGRRLCGCYAGAMQRPRRSVACNFLVAATVGLLATTGTCHAASTVVGWGQYYNGSTYVPVTIPSGLSNVVAIAAGHNHSLAVTADGEVVAWGWNNHGQTDVPSGLSNVVAVAGGSYDSLALTAEGRVVAWGKYYNGSTYVPVTIPSGLSNVVVIAGGSYHGLALTADDRVVGWGYNADGQTNIPSGLSNVVAIAAGQNHNLALTRQGQVVAWGWNEAGQTNIPRRLSDLQEKFCTSA